MAKYSAEALKLLVAEVRGLLADEHGGEKAASEVLSKLHGLPPKGPTGSLLPVLLRYQVLALKGVAGMRAGRADKAERVLLRATELRPQLPLAWKALSELYRQQAEQQSTSKAATDKLIDVLMRLVAIVEQKDKPGRLRKLNDALALAYARRGDVQRAIDVLSNSRVYDVAETWPRLALLYQQLSDAGEAARRLEQLYARVGHQAGLVDLYWRQGRLAELVALAQSMAASNAPSHAGLESLLVLAAADNSGVQLDERQRLHYARKLAFYWPDRPLAWTYLVADDDELQALLLRCGGAVDGWHRLARARLAAQQPRLCTLAIQHGMLTVQRLMRESWSAYHPLADQAVFWEQTPVTAQSVHATVQRQRREGTSDDSALCFGRYVLLFRLVEAELHADAAGFEAVLADELAAGQPALLAAAHRGIGRIRMAGGQLQPALEHFERAAALQPDEPSSAAAIGWLLHLQGRHSDGRQMIERAIALDEHVAEYRYYLAQVLLAVGEAQAAHAAHLAAAKLDGTQAKYFTAIGEHYRSVVGDAHNAMLAFRKAVSLDCHEAHAGVQLARLLLASGRGAEAVELYESVARRSSQADWAWIRLGEHQLRQCRHGGNSEALDGALQCFQTALRSAAGTASPSVRCLRGLASGYFLAGKYVAALKVFQRVAAVQPDDVYSLLHVGLIYAAVDMLAPAVRQFEQLLARHQHPVVAYLLAKTLHRQAVDRQSRGLARAAAALFARAAALLSAAPMNASPAYLALLARVRLAVRDYDGSVAALQLRSAVAARPLDHYQHGLALYAAGDLAAAHQAFRCAVEASPLRLAAWNALGVCARRPAEAQHAFLLCLAPDFAALPNHDALLARAWNNLGVLYLQHGRDALAQQAVHRAQALHPDGATAWAAQAHIHQQQRQHAAALAAYQHALDHDCSLFALAGVATVLHLAGDWGRAHHYLLQWQHDDRLAHSRDVAPSDHAWLHQLTARNCLRLTGVDQACQHLRRAVDLLPADQPTTLSRTQQLLHVLQSVQSGVAVDVPNAADAQLLAYAAFASGRPAVALALLQSADSTAAVLLAAMAQLSLGSGDAAAATLAKLNGRSVDAKPPLFYFLRAQVELHTTTTTTTTVPQALLQGRHLFPDSRLLQRLLCGVVDRALRRGVALSTLFPHASAASQLQLLCATATAADCPGLLSSVLAQCARSPGDLLRARRWAARAAHLDPADRHAVAQLAQLSYRLALASQRPEHFAAALASCAAWLDDSDAGDASEQRLREHLLLIMSDCHRVRGEFDAALKRAKDTGSSSPHMLRQVARTLYSQGRLEHAVQFYKKALKEAPPAPLRAALWQELALVYTKLSPPLFAAAELCYKQAIAVDASGGAAVARLVALYLHSGRHADAAALLDSLPERPLLLLLRTCLLAMTASDAEPVRTQLAHLKTANSRLAAFLVAAVPSLA